MDESKKVSSGSPPIPGEKEKSKEKTPEQKKTEEAYKNAMEKTQSTGWFSWAWGSSSSIQAEIVESDSSGWTISGKLSSTSVTEEKSETGLSLKFFIDSLKKVLPTLNDNDLQEIADKICKDDDFINSFTSEKLRKVSNTINERYQLMQEFAQDPDFSIDTLLNMGNKLNKLINDTKSLLLTLEPLKDIAQIDKALELLGCKSIFLREFQETKNGIQLISSSDQKPIIVSEKPVKNLIQFTIELGKDSELVLQAPVPKESPEGLKEKIDIFKQSFVEDSKKTNISNKDIKYLFSLSFFCSILPWEEAKEIHLNHGPVVYLNNEKEKEDMELIEKALAKANLYLTNRDYMNLFAMKHYIENSTLVSVARSMQAYLGTTFTSWVIGSHGELKNPREMITDIAELPEKILNASEERKIDLFKKWFGMRHDMRMLIKTSKNLPVTNLDIRKKLLEDPNINAENIDEVMQNKQRVAAVEAELKEDVDRYEPLYKELTINIFNPEIRNNLPIRLRETLDKVHPEAKRLYLTSKVIAEAAKKHHRDIFEKKLDSIVKKDGFENDLLNVLKESPFIDILNEYLQNLRKFKSQFPNDSSKYDRLIFSLEKLIFANLFSCSEPDKQISAFKKIFELKNVEVPKKFLDELIVTLEHVSGEQKLEFFKQFSIFLASQKVEQITRLFNTMQDLTYGGLPILLAEERWMSTFRRNFSGRGVRGGEDIFKRLTVSLFCIWDKNATDKGVFKSTLPTFGYLLDEMSNYKTLGNQFDICVSSRMLLVHLLLSQKYDDQIDGDKYSFREYVERVSPYRNYLKEPRKDKLEFFDPRDKKVIQQFGTIIPDRFQTERKNITKELVQILVKKGSETDFLVFNKLVDRYRADPDGIGYTDPNFSKEFRTHIQKYFKNEATLPYKTLLAQESTKKEFGEILLTLTTAENTEEGRKKVNNILVKSINFRGYDRLALLIILEEVNKAVKNGVIKTYIEDNLIPPIRDTIILEIDEKEEDKFRKCGSGVINQVFMVKFIDPADGKEKRGVFKPDAADALSYWSIQREGLLGTTSAWEIPAGSNAFLNYRSVASSVLNKLLWGDKRCNVSTRFAIINGRRGILMGLAPGKEINVFLPSGKSRNQMKISKHDLFKTEKEIQDEKDREVSMLSDWIPVFKSKRETETEEREEQITDTAKQTETEEREEQIPDIMKQSTLGPLDVLIKPPTERRLDDTPLTPIELGRIIAFRKKWRDVKVYEKKDHYIVRGTQIKSNFDVLNYKTLSSIIRLGFTDAISRENDRHSKNYFVSKDGTTTGIDEDCSHGERMLEENEDIRSLPPILAVVPNQGSLALRLPPVATKEMVQSIDELYYQRKELKRIPELDSLVSEKSNAITFQCLEKVFNHIHNMEKCLIVEDDEALLSNEALKRLDSNNCYIVRELLAYTPGQNWNHLRAHRPEGMIKHIKL